MYEQIDSEILAETGHAVDSLYIHLQIFTEYSNLLDTAGLNGFLRALDIE